MIASPFVVLTRHFVRAIVAPPLLTELGADFLRRTLASVFAILLVAGIFLTRALFKRYVDLYASWDEGAYFRAVQADTLLMIALPMLVVGITAVLLSPLLFPDETDYRTLSPLPISRRQIFAAKVTAVAVVAAAAVLAVNAISSFWFPAAIGGRWMPHPLPTRTAVHGVAAVAGSLWAFSAVMALQGICLAVVPARWRRGAGVVVHGTLFVALLLSIPYVLRMPTLNINSTVAAQAPLVWVPPVWFLGVERWLLEGSTDGYAIVARIAVLASAVTVTTIAISYAVLFRNAEQLASAGAQASRARRSRPAAVAPHALLAPGPAIPASVGPAHSARAVLSFVRYGLLRSRLHQIVFLLVAGIGVAILIGQWLSAMEGDTFFTARPRATVHAAIAAPLLVALVSILALRAAFLLPLDARSAWVFRLTETPEMRRDALNAVERCFTLAALVPSLAVALALQPGVLGGRWLQCALVTVLANLLLTEIVVHDWHRVPFTCTYLPGKRVLAGTLGILLGVYFVFVYIGANVIRWSLMHPSRTLFLGGLLLAGFAAVRRSRLRLWGMSPLEFEDEDPLAIRTLNLLPDERHTH